jgi:lauroyl/myristoyl acyltransferase
MIMDTLKYHTYSLGAASVRKMSDRRAYSLFSQLADRTWRHNGAGVQQYEKNIRRVVPDATRAEIKGLSRQCLHSYSRYWCDAIRMPDWPDEKIAELPVKNIHYLDESSSVGSAKPVVVAPHAGNYDYGAAYLALRYQGITTIAERLRPERLFDRFVSFRQSRGVEVLPTGTPNLIQALADRGRRGKMVALVGERDLSRKGVPVSFFGEEARMPAGPALIAREIGTVIHPVGFWYEGRQAHAEIFPAIQVPSDCDEHTMVREVTQAWADQIAKGIAANPGDWHMLQALWTADLDPARDPTRQGNMEVG